MATAGCSIEQCAGPWERVFVPSKIGGCLPPLRFPVDTTNITSPVNQFAIDVRVMYRFSTTQYLLTQLVALNVDPTRSTTVNLVLVEYVEQRHTKEIFCSLVVGYDNARNVEGGGSGTADGSYAPEQSNELQNVQFEQNLIQLGIKYSKHAVLQIFNWEFVNQYSRNAAATPILLLLEGGFDLLSYKVGEPSYRLPLAPSACGASGNLGILSMFLEVPIIELQGAIDHLSAYRPS